MARNTQAYIPPNLGKITFLDGRIKLRNMAEAVIAGVFALGLNAILSKFLPTIACFIIALLLVIFVALPALFGIGGEPLSIFILNIFNYSNSRTYVTLRPPQREVEGINVEVKKKETRVEAFINNLFTGGPAYTREEKEKPVKLTKEEKAEARVKAKMEKAESRANAKAEKQQAKIDRKLAKTEEKISRKVEKARAKAARTAERYEKKKKGR